MKKKNICRDSYGSELEVGMVVVPIIGEALLMGEGIISKINNNTLDLLDKFGNSIIKNANPKEYVRKRKLENRYSITFYNKHGYAISFLPLNEFTELEKLPEHSTYATLCYNHPNRKNNLGYFYDTAKVMTFYSKEKAHERVVRIDNTEGRYIEINESNTLVPLNVEVTVVNSESELLDALGEVIKYFKDKYESEFEEEYIIKENALIKRFNKNLKGKLNRLK